MRKLMFFLGLLVMGISSCGLKGSGEVIKGPQVLSVEFEGYLDSSIQNRVGQAQLLAVPADNADIEATIIDEVEFDVDHLPFSVEFEIPADHKSMIKPEIAEDAAVKYYVSLVWDSNADGRNDSLDVGIDYDKQFPHVDINQIHQKVFVK